MTRCCWLWGAVYRSGPKDQNCLNKIWSVDILIDQIWFLNHEQGSKKKRESNSNERCWRDFLKECWTVKSYKLRGQNSLIPPYPNFEYQSKNETDVASGMIEISNQMRRVRTDHTNLDEKGVINWEQVSPIRTKRIIEFGGSVLIVKGVGCELSGNFLECVSKLGSQWGKKTVGFLLKSRISHLLFKGFLISRHRAIELFESVIVPIVEPQSSAMVGGGLA